MRYHEPMTLANKITIGRALLIAPTVICLLTNHRIAALVLFGIACTSDIVDGMVARARNEITTWGKVLDPVADKALYVALLASLCVMGELPTLAFVLFLVPQLALGLGAIVLGLEKQRVQSARIIGKSAAFVAFIALASLIARWPAEATAIRFFYLAIALTYVASFDYLLGALRARSKVS